MFVDSRIFIRGKWSGKSRFVRQKCHQRSAQNAARAVLTADFSKNRRQFLPHSASGVFLNAIEEQLRNFHGLQLMPGTQAAADCFHAAASQDGFTA